MVGVTGDARSGSDGLAKALYCKAKRHVISVFLVIVAIRQSLCKKERFAVLPRGKTKSLCVVSKGKLNRAPKKIFLKEKDFWEKEKQAVKSFAFLEN